MPKKIDRSHQFCVAVAAHPTGGIDVQAEAELVKSCILYSDHIRLYSPTASLISQIGSAIKSMSREEGLNLALEFMRHTGAAPLEGDEAVQLREAALQPRRRGWTKRAMNYAKWQRVLQLQLDTAVADMGAKADEWRSMPAFVELRLAEERGLLSFANEDLGPDPMDQIADFVIAAAGGRSRHGSSDRDRIYKEKMLAGLLASVTGESEYPLLDRGVQGLVRAAKPFGLHESPTAHKRSKVAGLGENIFRRLPVPMASMDELLDIRQELDSVVSRFRSGLLKASSEIENAQWDESFQSEASDVYVRHIAPALDELDEALKSTHAFSSYFSKSASLLKATGVAGGLSLIADKLMNVTPEIIGIFGLTGVAVTFVAEQISAAQTRNKKARDNDWFLVYEARSKLER